MAAILSVTVTNRVSLARDSELVFCLLITATLINSLNYLARITVDNSVLRGGLTNVPRDVVIIVVNVIHINRILTCSTKVIGTHLI